MDINNAKSQMRKGMLEYCILLLLKRAAAYASDIIQGPPRKYYALTQEGEEFLTGLDQAWNELATTVNYLKTTHLLTHQES